MKDDLGSNQLVRNFIPPDVESPGCTKVWTNVLGDYNSYDARNWRDKTLEELKRDEEFYASLSPWFPPIVQENPSQYIQQGLSHTLREMQFQFEAAKVPPVIEGIEHVRTNVVYDCIEHVYNKDVGDLIKNSDLMRLTGSPVITIPLDEVRTKRYDLIKRLEADEPLIVDETKHVPLPNIEVSHE